MAEENVYTPVPRLIARGKADRAKIVPIGTHRTRGRDIYARMLGASWKKTFAGILTFYFAANILFGCSYFLSGGIENARPDSYFDSFFFSVQTFATIGYGKMAPVGLFANILVTLEALMGFAFYAVMTGLVFSKFSRPTARVLFSNVAVICPFDGVPHFMIRLANERHNRIVDANIHMVAMRDVKTKEGHIMRRFFDLPLLRTRVPLLQLSITAMHPIDEKSPLYKVTDEELRRDNVEIIISMVGLDETFSQTIHARYSYQAHEILCDHSFADIIERRPNNVIEINYDLFHSVKEHIIVNG